MVEINARSCQMLLRFLRQWLKFHQDVAENDQEISKITNRTQEYALVMIKLIDGKEMFCCG